jgi:hypothetical protein
LAPWDCLCVDGVAGGREVIDVRCKVREGDSGGSGCPEGEKQYNSLLCVLWYTHREICCFVVEAIERLEALLSSRKLSKTRTIDP